MSEHRPKRMLSGEQKYDFVGPDAHRAAVPVDVDRLSEREFNPGRPELNLQLPDGSRLFCGGVGV